MNLFLITLGIFILCFFGMAIGVIFSGGREGRELKGSCGGPDYNPECCLKCPEKDQCETSIQYFAERVDDEPPLHSVSGQSGKPVATPSR